MTNGEAIRTIKHGCIYRDKRGGEALEVAVNALEKQTPKKPTPHIVQPVEAPIKIGNVHWQKRTTVYKCPNCKEWVSKAYKHCPDCGQALDFNSNGSGTE